jgi:hypothetical protein
VATGRVVVVVGGGEVVVVVLGAAVGCVAGDDCAPSPSGDCWEGDVCCVVEVGGTRVVVGLSVGVVVPAPVVAVPVVAAEVEPGRS